MMETATAPSMNLERVYNRFQASTDTVRRFIADSAKLLDNPTDALNLAQHITAIACGAPSRQEDSINEMLAIIHPSKALRKRIWQTAKALKKPPAPHKAAAADLVPPLEYFLTPLDQPGNPALPGPTVLNIVRHNFGEMHANYIRSVAATMVNYSVMQPSERPGFITDMAAHLDRRNEALLNTAKVCRAVMHTRYPMLQRLELWKAWQQAELDVKPRSIAEPEAQWPERRKDVLAQMNLIAKSAFVLQCRRASRAKGADRAGHIAAANFWRQARLNVPCH